jgi:hypothetical protein
MKAIKIACLFAAAASLLEDHPFGAAASVLWDDLLRDERAPLILAGVGYHHPIYRSVSRYPYLVEQTVEGNFDHVTPGHLHAKVWPVVHDVFRAREEQVLGEYAALSVRGQTTEDLFAIARATVSRRVGYLLIAQGAHVWGLMDRGSGRIVRRSAQQDTRDGDVLVVRHCEYTSPARGRQ